MNTKQGKKLWGRKIVMYEDGASKSDRGWIYDPIIYLDDGSYLRFSVQESDDFYGVKVTRYKNGKILK